MSPSLPAAGGPVRSGTCVSLVHGFLANRFMLTPLAVRLGRRGFRPRPWGYWNMRRSILVHADGFARELRHLDAAPDVERIHVVTHSMGGIIARAAFDRYRPTKLGRFVMLAPPNHGSFAADIAADFAAGILGKLLAPVEELRTAADSLVNSLGMPNGVDIGVIAAGRDALVTEASTRPDAPHAHVTLPCLHSSLLFRRDAADLVAAFLADGRFPEPGIARPALTAPSPRLHHPA